MDAKLKGEPSPYGTSQPINDQIEPSSTGGNVSTTPTQENKSEVKNADSYSSMQVKQKESSKTSNVGSNGTNGKDGVPREGHDQENQVIEEKGESEGNQGSKQIHRNTDLKSRSTENASLTQSASPTVVAAPQNSTDDDRRRRRRRRREVMNTGNMDAESDMDITQDRSSEPHTNIRIGNGSVIHDSSTTASTQPPEISIARPRIPVTSSITVQAYECKEYHMNTALQAAEQFIGLKNSMHQTRQRMREVRLKIAHILDQRKERITLEEKRRRRFQRKQQRIDQLKIQVERLRKR